MAGLNETVSSQSPLKEKQNYDDLPNRSLNPKSKPPVLPKPQFVVSNIKNGKYSPVKKIQNSSQTIISVKNGCGGPVLNKKIPEGETLALNNKNISDSGSKNDEGANGRNLERISEKPPMLYPKPKLPPKLSSPVKTSRSNANAVVSSSVDPSQNFDGKICSSNSPIRPPRSPKRILKDNSINELRNKLIPVKSEGSSGIGREKSASLPRGEFPAWTYRDINPNSGSPLRYYQSSSSSPENCGNLPVEEKIATPTPRPRIKNKPKLNLELDLAGNFKEGQKECPIYATVDYSKKKNRQSNPGRSTKTEIDSGDDKSFLRSSSDSPLNCNSPSGDLPGTRISFGDRNNVQICIKEFNIRKIGRSDINENFESCALAEQKDTYIKMNAYSNNYSFVNSNYSSVPSGHFNKDIMNVVDDFSCDRRTDGMERGEARSSLGNAVPQSFLHRFVNSPFRAKEFKNSEEEEKKEDDDDDEEEEEVEGKQRNEKGNTNNSSFLHRHSAKIDVLSQSRESDGSFEIVTMEDVKPTEGNQNSVNETSPISNNSVSFLEKTLSVSDHGLLVNANKYEVKEFEERTARTSSCTEEGSNLGKRFPWFGSFGKGNKKRSEKKERCSSQFYATPVVVQECNNMSDCSRTKSLPNIKANDKTIDSEQDSYVTDWSNRNTDSLKSDLSTYTQISDGEEDKDSIYEIDIQDKGKKADKAFLIANELITSEEVFIDVLKLLNVDFRNFVQDRNKEKTNLLPQSNLNKILNHLPELQTLNEVLLADLKKRIQNWETNPKISDVIVKKGAFLKLYTAYIQNFESQTKYLDECVVKYPKFGKVLKEFESLERCKMLSLKHYMLKPVQRIPQYRLLLSDYLKHIDESSPDFEDTETALKIVSEVADHVNRNLKYGDKNGTLMHLQSLLSDYELIKPGRELIKEGSLEKICRKSVKDRYFILLNDCLLHTTYSKSSLKIHQELPLSGMKVCCNEEQNNRYCFTVYSTTRSFVLCAKSESERSDWLGSLQSAIEEYISRQKTFMKVKIPETDTFKIGKEAPVWIQDSKVTMCQICTAEFTSLFRRHHCRACGKVICKNCGGSQAPLQYDSFKPHRVCDQCFPILLKDYEDSEDEIYEILKINNSGSNQDIQNIYLNNKAKFIKYTSSSKPKFIPHRLKEVSANDAESEMNGLLYRKSRKAWKQYWYVLKEHVLYVYRASEDVKALETIPVLGYEVKLSHVNHENIDKNLIFFLEHRHQSPIIFHADTEESAERWFKALKKATEFEEVSGT